MVRVNKSKIRLIRHVRIRNLFRIWVSLSFDNAFQIEVYMYVYKKLRTYILQSEKIKEHL